LRQNPPISKPCREVFDREIRQTRERIGFIRRGLTLLRRADAVEKLRIVCCRQVCELILAG
jgi:hypothetical protein